MKLFIKILLIFLCLGCIYGSVHAGVVDIPTNSEIRSVTIDYNDGGDGIYAINNVGFRILTTIKTILLGVMVIFLVYTGFMMIYSMGSDEETLSKSKRQLWYTLVGILFINIPGTIYEAFYVGGGKTVGNNVSQSTFTNTTSNSNLFVDFFVFGNTLNDNIIGFFEILIFIAAVFSLVYAGILVMTSRGREDRISEAKNKVLYTILALVFVMIIEAWKRLAFNGSLDEGINLVENLSNLALFFAGPVAIFFLTLAGYYYITSNGDEERVKKAKSIIINTVLATLILLATYTFLLDLANL